MTKEQNSTVPEELYNLTQLAEVTLAAGRLSTTNLAEIEDYINGHKMAPTGGTRATTNSPAKREEDVTMRVLAEPLPAGPTTTHFPTNEKTNNSKQPAPTMAQLAQQQQAFYSSSDDDSNCYKYSHKVFDRRKSRRSTISEQSRYDEHSCSSLPSCSSDEHSSSSSVSASIACTSRSSTSSNPNITSNCHSRHAAPATATSDGYASGEGSSGSGCGSSGLDNGLLDGDEHICPECGKKYSTSSNLARHRQTHRSIMDKKARRCPYCEKVYVSMPAFSMHVRTHSQGCKCQYCGKCFSRPWLLQGHIRTHTGEKPFKCSVCQKAFADKSNLRAHVQTHSNTKPHACQRCGKAFALKSYLYKHEESSCMKNHTRGADSPRSGRPPTTTTANGTANTPSSPGASTRQSGASCDSAKSTLATKLLQKEKERLQAAAALASAMRVGPYGMEIAPATEVTTLQQQQSGRLTPLPVATEAPKSYTTLTSSMSLEDYEHFNRISVIQPNVVALPADPSSLETTARSTTFSNNSCPATVTLAATMQDQPVDFSPKNQFTHSTKTSPFELTGNYAMVA